MPNPTPPTPPSYYAECELVEDTIKYEQRRKTYAVVTSNIYVRTVWQYRKIRTKKYECTFRDVQPGVPELPAPGYLAKNNYVELNPESLDTGTGPTGGYGTGKWHIIDVQYTKTLESPISRRYTITWESYVTDWEPMGQESDSQ